VNLVGAACLVREAVLFHVWKMSMVWRADDERMSNRKREAAMLFSVAEEAVLRESIDEAWTSGSQALDIFRELRDDRSAAETVRLLVACHFLRGNPKAAETMALAELELFQELRSDWGEAVMLLTLTELNADRRGSKKREIARETGIEARAIFQDLKDSRMEAAVLLAMATIYDKQGKFQEALQTSNDALAIYRTLGDRTGEAKALHALAVSHGNAGKVRDAIKASSKALAIFKEVGARRFEAAEYLAIAKWCTLDRDWKQVLDRALSARVVYEEFDYAKGAADAIALVVEAHSRLGERANALKVAEEGFAQSLRLEDKKGEANMYEILARAHAAFEDWDEVVLALDKALKIVRVIGPKRWEVALMHEISQVYLKSQDIGNARMLGLKSIDVFKAIDDGKMEATAKLQVMASVYCSYGEYHEALDIVDEAMRFYQQTGDEKGEAIALFVRGIVLHLQGDKDLSLESLKKAQELLGDIDEKRAEAQVCRQIAEFHLERGRPEEACRMAHDARTSANRAKDRRLEAEMHIMVAQSHLKVMAKLANDSESVAFKSEWDKAMKAANSSKNLARKLGQKQLLGEALHTCADVLVAQGRLRDATEALEESLQLLEEGGHQKAQVSALVLKGNIALLRNDSAAALEAAIQALAVAKSTRDQDSIHVAQAFVSHLESETNIAVAAKTPEIDMVKEKTEVVVDVVEDIGPKALDPAVVLARLQELVSELIGNDVEEDTPFMDAGLDSLVAIQFRSELVRQFQGLGLASTITFDYPSARQLRDHIVERSVEAARRSCRL